MILGTIEASILSPACSLVANYISKFNRYFDKNLVKGGTIIMYTSLLIIFHIKLYVRQILFELRLHFGAQRCGMRVCKYFKLALANPLEIILRHPN